MFKKSLLFLIVIISTICLAACAESTTTKEEEKTDKKEVQKEITIRLAGYLPPTDLVSIEFAEHFIDRAEELTNNQVKFEYYPAEQLGKGNQLLDLLKNKTVEMALYTPVYMPDKLPLSGVIDLPNLYGSSQEGSQMLWNLIQNNEVLAQEYKNHDIKPLAAAAILSTNLFTVDKKVTELDDLSGMKIRSAGSTFELALASLGATPVTLPVTELYTALERKTVEGGVVNINNWPATQINKVARYNLQSVSFGGGSNILGIRQDTFDVLPDDIQKALVQAGEEAIKNFSIKADEKKEELKNEYTKQGIEFYDLDEEQQKIWTEKLEGVNEQWAQKVESLGYDGKALLDAALKLKTKDKP